MGNLNRFLKNNKKEKENTTYKATKSLTDENGVPLDWIIRPISTKENDIIRDDCLINVPIKGKSGVYNQKVNTSKYIAKLIVASVIEPNLNDKELQDSYGVMSAEDLIKEMIDDPGEYAKFTEFITKFNGFDETIDEAVEEAKN